MHKSYSWRSYTFLIISLLVPLSMMLLDPIATATTEQVGFLIIMFTILAIVTSVVLAVLTFLDKKEKKVIATIALLLTIINIAIVIFFMWFGANFA